MGWGGNIISSFVTQDGKDEYLNILVSFGFGPAANVQDIFLNQKPLSSYPDLSYHIRYGTNDQTTIPGFDTIENVYPQETELLAANPPTIVTGTGTNTSGLQIAVKFPGGLMRTDPAGARKNALSPIKSRLLRAVRICGKRRSSRGLQAMYIQPTRTATGITRLGGNAYGSLRRLRNCLQHGHERGRAHSWRSVDRDADRNRL